MRSLVGPGPAGQPGDYRGIAWARREAAAAWPPAAGLPPAKAAQAMSAPEGFAVKLLAAEPEVQQPIAILMR